MTEGPLFTCMIPTRGGVGLAEKAFHVIPYILKACLELIHLCPCRKGCPGCTGPEQEVGEGIKALSIQVLDAICDEVQVLTNRALLKNSEILSRRSSQEKRH